MRETIDTILTRRSVRSYLDRSIEPELLERLLTCALHAPSGGNHQEIRLSVCTDRNIIDQIRLLAGDEFRKMPLVEGQYKNIAIRNATAKGKDYDFTFQAPTLVIASGPRGWPNGMADSALCLGNLMLAAKAEGLASCYVNQLHWLDGNGPMRALLAENGLPAEEEIFGTVVLGYSAEPERTAPERKAGRIRFLKGKQ